MDEVELCIEFSGDQGVARFALVKRNQACLSNADDKGLLAPPDLRYLSAISRA